MGVLSSARQYLEDDELRNRRSTRPRAPRARRRAAGGGEGVGDIDRSQLTTTDSSASTTSPPIDFPQGGWSEDSKDAPSVCVGVIRAHLKQREVSARPTVDDREDSAGGEEDHTQKPFDRGFNFFYWSYVNGVEVARSARDEGGEVYFLKSRCWASQRKHTNYTKSSLSHHIACAW